MLCYIVSLTKLPCVLLTLDLVSSHQMLLQRASYVGFHLCRSDVINITFSRLHLRADKVHAASKPIGSTVKRPHRPPKRSRLLLSGYKPFAWMKGVVTPSSPSVAFASCQLIDVANPASSPRLFTFQRGYFQATAGCAWLLYLGLGSVNLFSR